MLHFLKSLLSKKKTITASMATVPWREDALQQVVESLLPQVDRLNIYLNEWDSFPDFLNHPKINAVMSQNEAGDLGDRGKFYWCEQISGYHLTVDDDILYPPDYVEKILFNLSRYPKAVVSYHGSILNYPVYAKKNNKLTHFAKDAPKDMKVALIGTGVLAYDANELAVDFSKFESNYWADGWFSLQVRNANFRCIVIRHKKGWLKPLPTEGPDIWSMNREESRDQQINQWIKEYHLWDEMEFFSERIQDRYQRWSVENEDIGPVKFIAEKLTGRAFAESQGAKVPKLYFQCDKIQELPSFDDLPENFVVKPSRGWSAQNVFVLRSGLNLLDGKSWTREQIVELITPLPINDKPKTKFMVEEFLEEWNRSNRIPLDYKFHMFGDKIGFISIVERNSNVNTTSNRYWFVDENWEPLPGQIMETQEHNSEPLEIPDCADELISTAKLLGKSIGIFMRIDLYATTRGAVFGEFTPQPHGGKGFTKWADEWLGSLWKGKEGGE